MTNRALAKRTWPQAAWINGDGAYASLAWRRGVLTVSLCRTEADAVAAKAWIDRLGCGGFCRRQPEVVTVT